MLILSVLFLLSVNFCILDCASECSKAYNFNNNIVCRDDSDKECKYLNELVIDTQSILYTTFDNDEIIDKGKNYTFKNIEGASFHTGKNVWIAKKDGCFTRFKKLFEYQKGSYIDPNLNVSLLKKDRFILIYLETTKIWGTLATIDNDLFVIVN